MLEVGFTNSTAVSSYELQDGNLITSTTNVRGAAIGSSPNLFTQSGGEHHADTLYVAPRAQYEFAGGILNVGQMTLNSQFAQTDGTHDVTLLRVHDGGHYIWTGGALNIASGWELEGQGSPAAFTFPTTPSSLSINGIVSMGLRTVTNAGNVSVTLGPESLLIYDPGDDPAADFASFTNQGMTHVRGTTLSIPAGKTVGGTGFLYDPVEVWGTIDPANGEQIGLLNTVIVQNGAYLESVSLSPRTTDSSVMYDGHIYGSSVNLGAYSASSFIQHDGLIEQSSVYVRGYRGAESVYEMHGGTLSIPYLTIGSGPFDAGPSRFEQTGGDVLVAEDRSLALSVDSWVASAPASYVMSGGSLQAFNSLYVGMSSSGHGAFQVTNASADITIGRSLVFGKASEFSAVDGTTIHLDEARFDVYGTDCGKLAGLAHLTLIATGSPAEAKTFEVAGLDMGDVLAGFSDNFVLDVLQLGDLAGVGKLQLVDIDDNSLADAAPEALYVNELILGAGSFLDLNGLNIYCRNFTNLGGTIDLSSGGGIYEVPEPVGLLLMVLFAPVLLGRRAKWSMGMGAVGRRWR